MANWMKMKFLSAALLCAIGAAQAAPAMNPAVHDKAQLAVDKGIAWLKAHQAADGSVGHSVGLTALALRVILENPRGVPEADKPLVARTAKFIASRQNPDGSIVEIQHDQSYNTAVSITALAATHDPQWAPVIAKAQQYIIKAQIGESRGFAPVDNWYGGMGYGGDERPDVSNLHVALEALKATALDPNDPVWKKAMIFATRMQNRSESNDQKWSGNDGGFAYSPGMDPPELGGGTKSYGSMTAAGMLSLLFAGTDKADPRVQAAYHWLTSNYTLDTNPGTDTQTTLFYFYGAYAKVMYAYGQDDFVDKRGQHHNWRNELADRLVNIQERDGSWINHQSKLWWEDKPELATSWALLALEHALK
ncbi:MAG: terpene cyclase/mutase family protein [Burkholderiales bacterium]|nr:terpene cyclase/mutase family protein [Burkholderiales bacterium]